jgi:hypothetical protein
MKYNFIYLLILFVFTSCLGGNRSNTAYVETPLDKIIKDYLEEPNYSVILADMEFVEASETYKHKYQILIEKDFDDTFPDNGQFLDVNTDSLSETTASPDSLPEQATDVVLVETDWEVVDAIFFEENIDNLGMTLLSKKNGVLDKNVAPAGMDNYVGNERYGRWEQSGSDSFWVFYAKYHFISAILYGGMHRYSYGSYNRYATDYRGKKGYYGTGAGNDNYGTKSNLNKNTSWSQKPQDFKSRVRSKVSKSATDLRTKRTNASRTNRNSSRYSRSSSRSGGGGFGK